MKVAVTLDLINTQKFSPTPKLKMINFRTGNVL
jgi:hypothetical protein